MNDNIVKGLVGGIIVGALGVTIVTMGTGWAVPKGTAEQMAKDEANKAVVEEFAKICLAQYEASPDIESHNARLKESEVYQQRDYIAKRKFSVMPGSTNVFRETTDRCNELITEKYLK
ncbi:MAG: hypothetical protein HKN60_01265 [Rhizobiales bacterium]|nr:hypothetical protein [Hyphomicrobiales bacterium]